MRRRCLHWHYTRSLVGSEYGVGVVGGEGQRREEGGGAEEEGRGRGGPHGKNYLIDNSLKCKKYIYLHSQLSCTRLNYLVYNIVITAEHV